MTQGRGGGGGGGSTEWFDDDNTKTLCKVTKGGGEGGTPLAQNENQINKKQSLIVLMWFPPKMVKLDRNMNR